LQVVNNSINKFSCLTFSSRNAYNIYNINGIPLQWFTFSCWKLKFWIFIFPQSRWYLGGGGGGALLKLIRRFSFSSELTRLILTFGLIGLQTVFDLLTTHGFLVFSRKLSRDKTDLFSVNGFGELLLGFMEVKMPESTLPVLFLLWRKSELTEGDDLRENSVENLRDFLVLSDFEMEDGSLTSVLLSSSSSLQGEANNSLVG